MWTNTDVPLAHLIPLDVMALGCMVMRAAQWIGYITNTRQPMHPQMRIVAATTKAWLKSKPILLSARQRSSVERAIRETCILRRWNLHAVNVRTNHAHTVVSIGTTKSELALNALKANATRQMREDGCWALSHSPWVDKGSRRNLWNELSVARAIDYVINGQGDELPEFD